jgi:2-polyprenyl-6-hydroxyphenyl methylase/3-demethylubiquinone-9 3-methyltransferase
MTRLTREERRDLHGQEYVERFEASQSRSRLTRVLPLIELPDEAVVLDVACGNGLMLEELGSRIAEYHGVDFSPEFIEVARRRAERIAARHATFHCESVQDFCRRRPSEFGVALALDVSEHIYDNEWLDILRTIRGSLKPDGSLYIHTPNRDFFVERLKARNLILKQFPEHVAVRTASAMLALLARAGFSRTEVHYLPHYNVLRVFHALSFLPVIGRSFKARLFLRCQP